MEIVNIEYDRIKFEIVGDALVAHENVVVEESLTDEDAQALSANKFILRRFDDNNYWVLSERLDSVGMSAGVEAMYKLVEDSIV